MYRRRNKKYTHRKNSILDKEGGQATIHNFIKKNIYNVKTTINIQFLKLFFLLKLIDGKEILSQGAFIIFFVFCLTFSLLPYKSWVMAIWREGSAIYVKLWGFSNLGAHNYTFNAIKGSFNVLKDSIYITDEIKHESLCMYTTASTL